MTHNHTGENTDTNTDANTDASTNSNTDANTDASTNSNTDASTNSNTDANTDEYKGKLPWTKNLLRAFVDYTSGQLNKHLGTGPIHHPILDTLRTLFEKKSFTVAICTGFVTIGIVIMLLNKNLPEGYVFITFFLVMKIARWYATAHNKCIVSYFECRLRRIKKHEGVVNALLFSIYRVANDVHALIAAIIYAGIVVYYHFFIMKGRLRPYTCELYYWVYGMIRGGPVLAT
jgi:hypothetical protein